MAAQRLGTVGAVMGDDILYVADRAVFHGPKTRTCIDCGAVIETQWIEMFKDEIGLRHFVPCGGYRCPNGPHEVTSDG